MARSQLVRAADVRAMLRLMGELAEIKPDPVARSRHLMEGLCRLLEARAGTDVVSRRVRDRRGTHEVCDGFAVVGLGGDELARLVEFFREMDLTDPVAQWVYARTEAGETHTRARRGIVDDAGWRESGHYREVRVPNGILEPLVHCRPAGDGLNVRTISLHRPDAKRPFGGREARLMDLFVSEALRLVDVPAGNLCGAGGARRVLSPREREVLDGLVSGAAVKQVARSLGLSPHTVGDHVKAIYRKLGVGSRAELMALVLSPGTCHR